MTNRPGTEVEATTGPKGLPALAGMLHLSRISAKRPATPLMAESQSISSKVPSGAAATVPSPGRCWPDSSEDEELSHRCSPLPSGGPCPLESTIRSDSHFNPAVAFAEDAGRLPPVHHRSQIPFSLEPSCDGTILAAGGIA